MRIRHLEEADYDPLIAVVDDWWGGRHVAHMLPRLFFIHFRDTSFAVDHHGATIAFLAGFVSQSDRDAAYIHFVGVEPNQRRRGIGRLLYMAFFEAVQRLGCTTVRCVTSPVNEASVAFHTRLDFEIEHVTGEQNGVPCTVGYELNGEHRVLFVKSLARLSAGVNTNREWELRKKWD